MFDEKCAEWTDHEFPEETTDTWDEERESWRAQKTCTRCSLVIDHSMKGCYKNFDKKHKIEDGTYQIEGGVRMQYRECLSCGERAQRPIE